MAALMMAGCVYLPHTESHYNAECDIEERHMTLEAHQLASIDHCSNDDCVAALVVIGAVAAASAVVSGSVVVTGNVVYWLEERGNCLAHDKAAGAGGKQDR